MEVISSIGLLVFFFSLVYLVYHFIRKIKNRERTLPKKKFYTALIGGFSLVLIGSSLTDTSVQDALDEALETNTVLVAENKELNSTNTKLEEDNGKLKKENEKANKELGDLTMKLSDFDKSEQVLKDQQAAHQEKTEAFEKEIADLKVTNTALTTEVNTLKSHTSNKVAVSSSSSSGSTSQQNSNVYYKNCTAARAAGVTPLYRGEPGYAKHLDRDGDGVACE